MSYTDYMRRKAAAAAVVLDTTPRKVDASFYTSQARMAATRVFSTSSRVGVIGNPSDMSTTGTALRSVQPMETTKVSGGRVPDASSFTAFVGGTAYGNELLTPKPAARLLMNSNAAGSISACTTIAEPKPYIPGTTAVYTPNMVPQTAASFTNNTRHCGDLGRVEPHIASELGPPLFVDDTISVNGVFGIGTGTKNSTALTSACPDAIHTHPAPRPRAIFPQRRPQNSYTTALSTDLGRKVGGLVPSDHLKYVERHHGNDLAVNPRRPARRFQIPAGTPAQLKINDPKITA